MRWVRPIAMGLVLLAAAMPRAHDAGMALAAQADKTKAYDEEFEKARQLLQRHEYFEALKGFQKANQLAGGRSAECLVAMAQAMLGMKTYQNVVETAQTAIELAQNEPLLRARAHTARGTAFQSLAEKDPSKLRAAEREFRQALEADPESRVADLHFNLGVVLMKQMRDEEGIAELNKELAQRANGSTADEARTLIANPRRARQNYAPAFSVLTADGQQSTLEFLHGKVVLLDFWGTWCPPCVRSVPSLRKLQKAHAQDAFVILSISSDEDGKVWSAFTAKNGMVWPQYWDENRKRQRTFGVRVFPTYVLLDGDGIERLRMSGAGYHESKVLADTIEEQLKTSGKAPAP
jgi:thiol-disulfide isomerase/thioredoxin